MLTCCKRHGKLKVNKCNTSRSSQLIAVERVTKKRNESHDEIDVSTLQPLTKSMLVLLPFSSNFEGNWRISVH